MAKFNVLYSRDLTGGENYNNPTQHLIDYLASQGIVMKPDPFIPAGSELNAVSENAETEEKVEEVTEEVPSENTQPVEVQEVVEQKVENNTETPQVVNAGGNLEILEM